MEEYKRTLFEIKQLIHKCEGFYHDVETKRGGEIVLELIKTLHQEEIKIYYERIGEVIEEDKIKAQVNKLFPPT